MPPLALVLALVLAPPAADPEASGATSTVSGTRSLLDEKITLNLQKADLVQVLDRLATLLGKTLIVEPGIEGTVTLDVRETPVSEVLTGLQASRALLVRLEGDRMYVTRAGEKARGPGKPDDEALDRAFLSDGTLPRRPVAEKPKRFDGSFEFRSDGAEVTGAWEIGGSLGTVTLSGCAGPLPVILLPGDAFDGIPRVVFGPTRGAALARIVVPGAAVKLPGCLAPFTLEAVDSKDGASKAAPVSFAGQFQLTVQILEAGAGGDEVLSAPRLQLAAGEAGTVQSGSRRAAASGLLLGQGIQMSVAILNAGDADALLACSVSVTRDAEPAHGEPPVTIRIARADESLRLAYGKPERVNVSPTYGRGHSSLVLEVMLERLPERPRAR